MDKLSGVDSKVLVSEEDKETKESKVVTGFAIPSGTHAVSYTHLTLPTKEGV